MCHFRVEISSGRQVFPSGDLPVAGRYSLQFRLAVAGLLHKG